MTSAFTDPRSPGDKPGNRRPQIWAGGKRRAGIPAGVLWRHAREGAREWMIPRLEWLGDRMARGGHAVAAGAGAAGVARLGRAAVALPPRRHVAAALAGTGRLSLEAAKALAGPPPVEPLALRPWQGAPGAAAFATPQPRPVRAEPKAEASATEAAPAPRRLPPEPLDETDLSILGSIREAIRAPVAPQRPRRAPPPPPPAPRGAEALPDLSPPEPPEAGPALRLAARGVALVAHGLALPVGAVLTLRAVLRGEGLED